MGQKLIVGPIKKGLRTDVTPFNIDNDAFPALINAYQWRSRVKRKRGTTFLVRLQRYLGTTNGAGNLVVTIAPVPVPTGISSFTVGSDVFVDPGTTADPATQTLITNSSGTGTLNRVTGVLTITGSQANTAVIFFPSLPVMGLEDLILNVNQYPGTLGFDTRYSYNISTTFPAICYDVSFYKNPASAVINGAVYTQKTTWTPTSWNGEDYQQFWTVNYQGALWATNGINIPFTGATIGMQFNTITAIAIVAVGPPASATITTSSAHGLVIGDFVFINEVVGITGINFQTGFVTAVPAANQITVSFPYATLGGAYASGGIVQYLTSRSNTSVDCIRWYDGDPTNGSATAPSFVAGKGWVNFCPPLSQGPYSIADLPAAQYYLVGARMILPFKDRLLFIGPVVQTSSGSPIYLQDTVIYSLNGTPYYTASFTGNVVAANTVFHELLVPTNQTAFPPGYFEDQTGFGGFITAGLDQPINTASSNEDVLILGFSSSQVRYVYTGNDIVPFNLFLVNSEYGSSSTFSAINMDKGVISRGDRGYIMSSQTQTDRVDLDILDEVFEMKLNENGAERFTAQRDFISEWIYFTYPSNSSDYKFPTITLLYNYRDDSWATFYETYTTYGQWRQSNRLTWATVGSVVGSWGNWNTPWKGGSSTVLQPDVIAGNQQGFVVIRDNGTTEESNTLYIQNISGNTITCPNHCLNEGDFIIISGALGTVGTEVNDKIFSVGPPITTNTFVLNPIIASGTYLGGGVIKRIYRPFIQTKQFPLAWDMARKTRLGIQQYLLTTTANSQIQLLIYLSQNGSNPYNDGPIVPDVNSDNDSLIYSTVLYTCPESTNLGLTPANINLNMVTAQEQAQIWHRVGTSLIGDTVQLGFTLSEEQMRAIDDDGNPISQFSEIELHGIIMDVNPSMLLA